MTQQSPFKKMKHHQELSQKNLIFFITPYILFETEDLNFVYKEKFKQRYDFSKIIETDLNVLKLDKQ